jgi:hypothetical protein
MLQTQNLLPDRQRFLIVQPGFGQIALSLKGKTQVIQALGHVRVLWTQNLLSDRQRSLQARPGSRRIAVRFKEET